jgi:hypothetical protein
MTSQCEECPVWWANRRLQIAFQVQRRTEGLLHTTWFPYTQRSDALDPYAIGFKRPSQRVKPGRVDPVAPMASW